MNYLKHITNIFLKLTAMSAIVFAFGGAGIVFAEETPRLVVDFNPKPLFKKVDFLPGDGASGTVTVYNNSDSSQNIITESINGNDNDGLGNALYLTIKEGEGTYYDNTLHHFLTSAGEVVLSTIPSGGSAVYDFEVIFAGDETEYQGATLGFDICVGFEGEEEGMACGDTEISGEGDTDGGDNDDGGGTIPGSGNGGGGGGGPVDVVHLKISNEDVTKKDVPTGTALIEWDTNLLSTSKVIYGLASGPGAPYSLNLTVFPNFGYPSGTDEDMTKVTHHEVQLTGLVPGELYVYRVVSRASPPTVSYERTFTLAEDAGNGGVGGTFEGVILHEEGVSGGGEDLSGEAGAGVPELISAGEEEKETPKEEEQEGAIQNLAAAAAFAIPDNLPDFLICALYFLLAIIIIFIIQQVVASLMKRGSGVIFWIAGIIIAIAVAYLLGKYCVIVPLLALLAILILWYISEIFSYNISEKEDE